MYLGTIIDPPGTVPTVPWYQQDLRYPAGLNRLANKRPAYQLVCTV